MFKKKIIFSVLFLMLVAPCLLMAQNDSHSARPLVKKGIWVSVFSRDKVLCSKKGISNLIKLCKDTGINEVYLQVFQSGNPYYDSKIMPHPRFEEMVKVAGFDPIDMLLKAAKQHNIKVFAWINLLSLGENSKADILVKYGESVLTLDQYGRPSLSAQKDDSDKFYLREKYIFLEPGDPRVQEYILKVVSEVINRYPLFNGVHLDYIRYPSPLPFTPGSRFNKFGITYGYNKENISRFVEENDFNPQNQQNDEEYLIWDNWKRQQVTGIVSKISALVKKKSPRYEISAAVIPVVERAYSNAFQDWPGWLEEGIVDYVVLMSYTRDNQFIKETVKSALGQRGKGKVYIGIGAFLFKNKPELLAEQLRLVLGLRPDGISFFSFADMNREVIESIR
jgi:uncharacterized lipoprotein YddW (UPF0748 family)